MKVSVITPVYNSARFIEETIQSVIRQTYTNFEMILVDDCSSDNSEEIIKKYASIDKRIKYIKLDKNSGAAVARNTAIELATGRFLAFLDSDDLWKKNKLEKQVKFMIDKNIGFSYASYETIREDGTSTGKVIKSIPSVDYEYFLRNTIIGCLTVMIDTNIIKEVSIPLIKRRQDYAAWLGVLKKGYKAYGMEEVLGEYRLVSGSISSNKLKTARMNWHVYRNIEKLSLAKTIRVFSGYAYYAIKKRL